MSVIASPAAVLSVRVGPVAPLGQRRVPSGFLKRPVDGPVALGTLGFVGDAQADRRVHGGHDKAVYAYPASAYATWRAAVPQHAARLQPGAMGENLALDGWSDADVAIGDVVQLGTAIIEVSEPRTPCYKLALAFDDVLMVKHFARIGISGWYYRVVEPGVIGVGDMAHCLARPNPDWNIARFNAAIASPSIADLMAMVSLAGLSDTWRRKAERLLAKRAAA